NEAWKEGQALKHFADGVAKMNDNPQEAEAAFRSALPLWEELVAAPHSQPAHWHNPASTYRNLGVVLLRRGRVVEAEESFLQALAHFDKLTARFPAYRDQLKDREAVQTNLATLQATEAVLHDKAEEYEG